MSYTQMATVYDFLMKDAPYQKWAEFTEAMISEHAVDACSIVDLGCGTGTITRLLARRGYQVTGVDNAESMLTIAQNRAVEEKVDINWVLQDIRELDGFQQVDIAVSFCDVLNYITEPEQVEQVIRQVNKALKVNGLFIFDFHSINHVEENLQGETFAEIYEDISYIWLCDPGDWPGEVFHDLTFFIRENGLYRRFDETHHQRTFELDHYAESLKINGFQLEAVHGDFSLQPGIKEDTERIFIVAKKIGEAE